MSWVNELRLDMDNAVRLVEKTIRSRMPTMLRATGKPLSDREVGDISTLLAAAVAKGNRWPRRRVDQFDQPQVIAITASN